MAAGLFPCARIRLDEAKLSGLASMIGESLGLRVTSLAFYVGPPSSHRKATILAMGSSGRVAGYAKLAVRESARRRLRHEAEVLADLEGLAALVDRIPRVVGRFRWAGGDGTVLTAGPQQAARLRPTREHVEFLERLHASTAQSRSVLGSEWWRSMHSKLDRLQDRLPLVWSRRYERVETYLDRRMGDSLIPLSRAHRDFTPWNVRRGPVGLFAFDWELSRTGVPPLHDLFHYESVQAALLGRVVPSSNLTDVLLRRIWPEGLELQRELRIAYLSDTSLHYVQARLERPDEGEDSFRDWLGDEIDALIS
jgi:hypothetical protein